MSTLIKGLGIITLLCSLSLLFLGTLEAKQALPATHFLQTHQDNTDLHATVSGVVQGMQFKDALQHQQVGSVELHQLIRKLPVVGNLLLLLVQADELVSIRPIVDASHAIALTRDLSVSYRNLRI